MTVTLKEDYVVCCFQRVHVCHTVLPHSTSTVAVLAHKSSLQALQSIHVKDRAGVQHVVITAIAGLLLTGMAEDRHMQMLHDVT